MLTPRWWRGFSPIPESSYKIDFQQFNASNTSETLPQSLQEHMKEVYNSTGLMLLKNTGTTDLNVMKKWAEVIMGDTTDYEGGANSRAPIGAAVYDTGAPANAHLHYHHEMAYVNQTVTN